LFYTQCLKISNEEEAQEGILLPSTPQKVTNNKSMDYLKRYNITVLEIVYTIVKLVKIYQVCTYTIYVLMIITLSVPIIAV